MYGAIKDRVEVLKWKMPHTRTQPATPHQVADVYGNNTKNKHKTNSESVLFGEIR